MLEIWDAGNFRRTLAGLALISAPLALMLSEVVYGRFFSQEFDEQFFAAVAEQSGIWTFATLLGLLAAVLFVPAVIGMVYLAKDKGVVIAHAGGALAVAGAVGCACHARPSSEPAKPDWAKTTEGSSALVASRPFKRGATVSSSRHRTV